MRKPHKITVLAIAGMLVLAIAFVVMKFAAHSRGTAKAERTYHAYQPAKLPQFGSTTKLSILPLVNWHTASPNLQSEMGVSYLIKTDSSTILFDLGHNAAQTSPSPLEHNMARLGIALDDIDIIFLSHNHFDHIGGKKWVEAGSFSFGLQQMSLTGKEVYTPVPMTYPGISPIHTPDPIIIAHGVASTGTIPRQLFMGWIDEQALAINVEGKGIILIVGCGHQTVPRLIERTEAVFDQPIYGLVGDLHYPLPEGRLQIFGLNAQRIFASGKGPLRPITGDELNDHINLLKTRNLGVIGVGGHDSSDEVIEQFHQTFGSVYRYVRVGEWIKI